MFDNDLNDGKVKEQLVGQFFQKYFNVVHSTGYDKGKDMTISGKVEVKFDRLAHRTGNVAFEIRFKGQPSGISASEATSWAICTVDGCWLIDLKTLKFWIKDWATNMNGRLTTVRGGDNNESEMILIPYNFVKLFWKII